MTKPALVLFVKAARQGEVKTRLCPPLTPAQACALHRAFAQDVMSLTTGLPAHRILATNDIGDPFVTDLARRAGVPIRLQHPGDLGERMADVFEALAPAHRGVVILGGDCPTLPVAHLREALEQAATRLVVGPAVDGGYVLIGAPRPAPHLFAGVRWGGPTVLADTLTRAAAARDPVHLLPRWYDVDTEGALAQLRAHLLLMPAEVAPATRAALGALG